MSTLIRPRTGAEASPLLRPLAHAAMGVALVALAPGGLTAGPIVLAALGLTALILAALPIRLPAQPLPISLLALALGPLWLLGGTWSAAIVGVGAGAAAALLRRSARLPLAWLLASTLCGVGCGGVLGALVGLFPLPEPVVLAGRAAGFALGLWLGQTAIESLSPYREATRPGWRIGLLTNLALIPPAVFLAEIGEAGEVWPFVASLGLAVSLMVLIRATINSQTRSAELEQQAVSSADARQHLELIVDHAPEAIFGMDREGNVRWLNRTAQAWLGERADAAVGRPATQAVPVRAPSGELLDHVRLLARAAEERRPLHEEGLLDGAAGAPQRILASYTALDEAGSEELGLVLMRDASLMTESLREQEELAVHLSHELRAPLTTILGYTQLMSSLPNSTPDTQAEFAKRIGESGDYMLRLVNNLLDLGRVARDGSELPTAEVDVGALTRAVVEAHCPQASEKGQDLAYDGPSGALSLVTSDLAIRQILTNLVANGVKYTPPGGKVRVELRVESDVVVWRVVDTGIGLSPEEQAKLFTRFFRSQRPEARLIKGTGLGLALTRVLVERLGGSVEVESVVDQGSSFTVRLPRSR